MEALFAARAVEHVPEPRILVDADERAVSEDVERQGFALEQRRARFEVLLQNLVRHHNLRGFEVQALAGEPFRVVQLKAYRDVGSLVVESLRYFVAVPLYEMDVDLRKLLLEIYDELRKDYRASRARYTDGEVAALEVAQVGEVLFKIRLLVQYDFRALKKIGPGLGELQRNSPVEQRQAEFMLELMYVGAERLLRDVQARGSLGKIHFFGENYEIFEIEKIHAVL